MKIFLFRLLVFWGTDQLQSIKINYGSKIILFFCCFVLFLLKHKSFVTFLIPFTVHYRLMDSSKILIFPLAFYSLFSVSQKNKKKKVGTKFSIINDFPLDLLHVYPHNWILWIIDVVLMFSYSLFFNFSFQYSKDWNFLGHILQYLCGMLQ